MIRIGAGNKQRKHAPDAVRGRLRPTVMALEGRTLLSTIVVNNLTDTVVPGQTNLRQAITQANTDGGGDTIVFSGVFNKPQIITLSNRELQLTGKATTTITGPGAALLSISGNSQSRVFNVFGTAQISGLTVTNGHDQFGGGGIHNMGTLTLTDVVVDRNDAGYGGGLANNGNLSLAGCTITGNYAAQAGGGLSNGIAHYGPEFGELSLTNCTISGNTVLGYGNFPGGGGLFNESGTATVTNCTITGNTAPGHGGGLHNSAELGLTNTIVAGNAGGDIDGRFGGGNNLVGDGSGISSGAQNLLGTPSQPINPLLGPNGLYGGPTPTFPLLPGSPAIGGGTTAGAPATDQRGVVRPTGKAPDIGAFQSQGFILTPVAGSSGQSAPKNTMFANPLAVTVTAVNPVEPVNGGIVSFAAPASGASAALSAATAVIQDAQASVTATANTTPGSYTVTAVASGVTTPAGFALTNTAASLSLMAQPIAAVAGQAFINVVLATFTDAAANAGPTDFVAAIAWGDGITTSSSTVTALGQGRFDVLGTHTYVNAGTYTFSVQVTDQKSGASALATSTATVTAPVHTEAVSLTVTTTRDVVDAFDGLTSLREAIAYANCHPGPESIRFDPAAFGKVPRTIVLRGGPLLLIDPATTTILGPGAKLLKISGGGKSRVFDIQGGSLALSGLTISGGKADLGGGIKNARGKVVLDHVIICRNSAFVGGGLFNNGSAALSDVVIRGNAARVASGLFSTRNATLSWRRLPDFGRLSAWTSSNPVRRPHEFQPSEV
jgi:hypothetical protein